MTAGRSRKRSDICLLCHNIIMQASGLDDEATLKFKFLQARLLNKVAERPANPHVLNGKHSDS